MTPSIDDPLNWQSRPLLWRHFRCPVGAGGLVDASVTGASSSAADDSSVEVQLKVENTPNGPIIIGAAFLADGGVAVIAAASWVCDALISSQQSLAHVSASDLGRQLQLALELKPVERAAALLVEDALAKALEGALVS